MSDKQVDEINLKDLSKKIAQSGGTKSINKAMKKSKDKTVADLAAMRKRLDALKAGYAAESVELEEGVIDQVKDIVAKKQAKKISGVMVDMFTASAICQIYDKVNDANKAKMDKLPIVKLADVAMKMMKRESVELDEAKIISRKPHPDGGHIVKLKTDGGQTVTRHLKNGKVKTMKAHKESVEIDERTINGWKISKLPKGGEYSYEADKSGYASSKFYSLSAAEKFVEKNPSKNWHKESIDEVLDTPKAMQSYRDKAKYSADRAASSAAAKILRGKDKDGNRADHSPEVKTRDKRAKGLKMVDRNAARKTFKALRKEATQIDEISGKLYNKALAGRKDKIDRTRNSASANALRMNKPEMKKDLKKADDMQRKLDKMKQMGIDRTARNLRKEETHIDEASKEGTIRIIDLGRMGKGKGFQVQRMTKGKFVDQGKPYKSQKDAEKVRKDGQHSMQFEAAPKIKGDWLKKERERNREHDAAMGRTPTGRKKPTRTMTSTQKSLASIRKEMKDAFEPHMMYDPKTGKGYKAEKEADHERMKKMGYTHDKPAVNEKYKIIHKTMSAALQCAYDEAKKKGYEVDKDDIDNKVAMGPRKPSSGKTNSYNLGLSKNGKPVKQKLHVQVYNMDNKGYELNMYVS